MDEKFRVQINKNTSVNIAAFLNLFNITSIEITCEVQNHKVIKLLTIKGRCSPFYENKQEMKVKVSIRPTQSIIEELILLINKTLNYDSFIELDIHSFNYSTGILTKLNTEIFMMRCDPYFKSSRFRPMYVAYKEDDIYKENYGFLDIPLDFIHIDKSLADKDHDTWEKKRKKAEGDSLPPQTNNYNNIQCWDHPDEKWNIE